MHIRGEANSALARIMDDMYEVCRAVKGIEDVNVYNAVQDMLISIDWHINDAVERMEKLYDSVVPVLDVVKKLEELPIVLHEIEDKANSWLYSK